MIFSQIGLPQNCFLNVEAQLGSARETFVVKNL